MSTETSKICDMKSMFGDCTNLKDSPFFADMDTNETSAPFIHPSNITTGLTIDNLPPRPSRPPMRPHVAKITMEWLEKSLNPTSD